MKTFLSELKTSVLLTLVLVAVLCGAYPLVVWAGAQVLFPAKANGSLVTDKDGTVRGSVLLAQSFTSAKYFQPRPSAAGTGYDATSSGGTNLGPTSAKLANGVHAKDAAGKDVACDSKETGEIVEISTNEIQVVDEVIESLGALDDDAAKHDEVLKKK